VRLDWLEPTLSEGGTTVGRAWAVTIELVELLWDVEAVLDVSSIGGPTVSVTLYPLSLIRLTMSPWWRVLMSTWFTARILSPT
jgi:hypothetical protein